MVRLFAKQPGVCLALLLFFTSPCFVRAAATIDQAQVQQIAAMLTPRAAGLGQPISNRRFWSEIARQPAFEQFLHSVHKQVSQPFPKVSDDLFLDFSRTGNRDHWQHAEFGRRELMGYFAMAECLENKGTFLPALEVAISEICAEHTWVYPAHDTQLKNFRGIVTDIDLGASHLGWQLATIDYWLAEKLSPATRALIRENLERRIFKPYRNAAEGKTQEIHWMRATHNWNAVCNAGVVGAALAALDSPQDRAWFIVSAQFYLGYFLKGFGADGYCSEGLGYWNYGFGRYVMLSETIRQATSGKMDLLANPAAQLPARFGWRAEILNGVYPSIADCHPGSEPDPQLTTYLCQHLDLKPCNGSRDIFVRPSNDLSKFAVFALLPDPLPRLVGGAGELAKENDSGSVGNLRTWFSEGGVLICRPATKEIPFAVSLKGGNNAEHHNHNDVGSFIVVARRSMVLVDPGSEVYTARTFGSHRYDSDVLNSFGHDVPVVSGQLQRPGAQARAKVLRTDFTDAQDTLALDISSAYAVTNLSKLERTFTYKRGAAPSLTVRDDVAFSKDDSFETALVTWGTWKNISPNELVFSETTGAVRVKIDTGGVPFTLTSKQLEADVSTPTKATRIALQLKKPVRAARIVMTITPEKSLK